MQFINWAIAVRGILIKIYETVRWYAQQKGRPKKADVLAETYKELGEIRGITRRYRYRQKKVATGQLYEDIKRISRINTELDDKIKNLTGKSLFDVLKDPPQEFPTLPSDETLTELPVLELIIKEEMKNIGNIAMRTQRQIRKIIPEIK